MQSGRKKLCRAVAALGLSVSFSNLFTTTAKANSITTLFGQNNDFSGNFFDIVTNGSNLTVTGLDVNVTAGVDEIDVYDRSGSYVGNTNSSSGWVLASQTVVNGLGIDQQTPVDVTPFVLPANSTIGMYITVDTNFNASSFMYYTNGNNTYSNGDLTIYTGQSSGGMFCASGLFDPRTWNGTITYNLNGTVTSGNTSQGTLVWNGNVNSSLDTTTPNFFGNGSSGVPFPATAGYGILFDDTATGTTNVVIAATGLLPGAVTFSNSSKTYNVSGADLNVGGSLNVSGGGTVAIYNNQSYGSVATVSNNSTLNIASPGSLTASSLNVNSATLTGQGAVISAGSSTTLLNGGNLYLQNTAMTAGSLTLNSLSTMNVTGGSLVASAISVGNQATLNIQNAGNVAGASSAPLTLTGSGTINLNGGTLLAGGNTNYSGNLFGTGGLNLSAGFITVGASSLQLTGPITVGTSASSTAYLLIMDGSGTAGQNSSGTPLTITVAGTGPVGGDGGYSGVLQGPVGGQGIFAANIIITPGTVISGAYGEAGLTTPGTLMLTGAISGTGPVYFSSNGNDETVLAHSNTYTGETRIQGTTGTLSSLDVQTLQLGANNGISPVSGLNIIGTTSVPIFDLNGYNQTVAYLTGGAPNAPYANISSLSGNSVLTVNNAAATSATFNGSIAGYVLLAKTGLGTQILTGNNSYLLGTNVNGGTLIPGNSNAIGTGPITFGGGTLSLPGIGGNLTGFNAFQFNGTAFNAGGGVIQLTGTGTNQSGSAIVPDVLGYGVGFSASFLYTPTAGKLGGGMTFTIENDPRGIFALGSGNAYLGYGGTTNSSSSTNPILDSAALQFNYSSSFMYIGFGTNGKISTTTELAYPRGQTGPNGGDPFQVSIVYNGAILSETITDTSNARSATYNYSTNLTSLLGGASSVYFGFTGSTGATGGTQNISGFTFNNSNLSAPISLSNSISTAPNTGTSILTAPGGGLAGVGTMNLASGTTLKLVGSPVGNSGKFILQTPSLSIAGSTNSWTGRLDITIGAVDVQNTDIGTVTNQIKQGYGGGTWQGSGGIVSSSAAADTTHLTAVGAILNNVNGTQLYGNTTSLGQFETANPGSNDVLIKYTYYGDTNLDGKVDGTDYSRIDAAYSNNQTAGPGSQMTGWFNGDFNYDGVVDGSDYTLIDNAFNTQGAALSTELATPTSDLAGGASAETTPVPEPASLTLLGVATLALLARRRQRHCSLVLDGLKGKHPLRMFKTERDSLAFASAPAAT